MQREKTSRIREGFQSTLMGGNSSKKLNFAQFDGVEEHR